mmetsp:Transcript_88473/g.245729  ORF Transcript_88473/g.245729 Transcript_88473/m.245729 type:complete len:309 (-) Transcript_88473:276-1202(-)
MQHRAHALMSENCGIAKDSVADDAPEGALAIHGYVENGPREARAEKKHPSRAHRLQEAVGVAATASRDLARIVCADAGHARWQAGTRDECHQRGQGAQPQCTTPDRLQRGSTPQKHKNHDRREDRAKVEHASDQGLQLGPAAPEGGAAAGAGHAGVALHAEGCGHGVLTAYANAKQESAETQLGGQGEPLVLPAACREQGSHCDHQRCDYGGSLRAHDVCYGAERELSEDDAEQRHAGCEALVLRTHCTRVHISNVRNHKVDHHDVVAIRQQSSAGGHYQQGTLGHARGQRWLLIMDQWRGLVGDSEG